MDKQEESDEPLVSGRIRKYTPKAKDIFEENVSGYYKVLSEIRTSIIDKSLKYLDQYSENAEVLKEVRQVLLEGLEKYHEQSKEFREYLLMQKTTDSINELYAFKVVYQATEHKVRYGLRFIDERTAELNQLTQDSHDSKASQSSHHSKTSQSSHHSKASQSSHHSKTSQSSHHSQASQSSHHSQASQSSHHSKTSQSSHHSQASQSSHHSKTSRSSHQSKSSQSSHQSKSSQSSHSTKTSHRSSKDIYIDKKSKAETAKVRLKIIEEEETLKREQNKLELEVQKKRSDLESNLTVLKHKREVAEAEAELSVVREVLEDKCDSISNKSGKLPDNEICTSEIVKSYVASQKPEVCVPVEETKLNPYVPEFVPSTTLPKEIKTSQPQQTMLVSETPVYRLDSEKTYTNEIPSPGIIDLTKYIMKKDIMLSRMSQFDDKPEKYCSWKRSFKNIMKELDATSPEELDLLNKWLGPQSKKQASSLRVANVHDETRGLEKIWERLDERYGAPESVAASLKERLDRFPKIKNNEYDKLYELADLLSEIDSVKQSERYKLVLAYFDASYGVNEIVTKLPYFMQTRWIDHASKYKLNNSVMYPPFRTFAEFIHSLAVKMNDPSFKFQQTESGSNRKDPEKQKFNNRNALNRQVLNTKKTKVENQNSNDLKCPVHEEGKHSLVECRSFPTKPLAEKREIIKKHGICFKCLKGKHLAKDCSAKVKCEKCGNSSHCTAFHIERQEPLLDNGGERKKINEDIPKVGSLCTEICGDANQFNGKSCAKTLLINLYPKGKPEQRVKTYAIIDDQSNRSLATSEFFDTFSEHYDTIQYTLSSCSGKSAQSGRRATGFILESFDRNTQLECTSLIECNDIPNSKQEIATPAVARQYSHLESIAEFIPELDHDANISLLIGRDMISCHHILDQIIGKDHEPYAQRLRLGWTIIGEACLGLVHTSDVITVNKTSVLPNQEITLKPCEYNFKVKDTKLEQKSEYSDVFEQTVEDNEVGLSREDKEFITIMENGVRKESNGNFSAPLPFRKDGTTLSNNYEQARKRAENLGRSLKRDPKKLEDFLQFMEKILKNNHAELAPPIKDGEEVWYLPIFGVYHAKKLSKIRVVFDSSAKYHGICLNDVLLKGPDLTNNLVSVLSKFRIGQFAAIADVEQMFFNFEVQENHRDFLRFIWFKDNDIEMPLVEYRMRVHVFGNSPSPSVANYCLRKAVCNHEGEEPCDNVCKYVKEHFYVDDGLLSSDSEKDIASLIKRTQDRLMTGGNIRLHKILSNSNKVLSSFPQKDLAKNITEIDFDSDASCLQRSLGLSWDVIRDIFTYQVSADEKPYTKRGVLSVINGIFDPIGFVAPVILGGRLIMRQALQNASVEWDDPLPEYLMNDWQVWKQSLKDLETLEIRRSFTETSLGDCSKCELHIFSDASKDAIASVAYIRTFNDNGHSQLGFVLGKSKLAPNHGHTIPRLELCAAVLATELASFIQKTLEIPSSATYFYTDSQVVLGYLYNETRRFYVYVSNRVDRILKVSTKLQWNYVPTNYNPADHGTRPLEVNSLRQSEWLKGPNAFFESQNLSDSTLFEVIEPEVDKEVRPLVEVKKTFVKSSGLDISLFEHFSTWTSLVRGITFLKRKASMWHKNETDEKNSKSCVTFMKESEKLIIKEVQQDTYYNEIDCLKKSKPLQKNSSLIALSPVLDSDGLLRVGGRLKNSDIESCEKMPVIIPGKSYIATLIVKHCHNAVQHMGRHFTEGAIRSRGIWLTGGKRLINSILHNCIKCRKLRGSAEQQKMADLPSDRLTPSPPFTYVGVDTFDPWSILTRRTRGGSANTKRWAIMFSCLVTRAIHIEVVEEMTSSSFINALRRFTALRGPVKEFRSDQGTNFIGAINELDITSFNIEDQPIKDYLQNNGTIWKFNPPHASNMSGAWERMIGLARKILNSMLCDIKGKQLTHEILCTLMAEVCCIVNNRPITVVSSDPESPHVLSPNVLLTHKTDNDTEYIPDLSLKDTYKAQWKQVQVLANQFWKRWKTEYLHNLQLRKKWEVESRNLCKDDIVLMIDDTLHRNQWLTGTIVEVYPSSDGLVRKALVRVIKNGEPTTYIRPISKLVYLFSD